MGWNSDEYGVFKEKDTAGKYTNCAPMFQKVMTDEYQNMKNGTIKDLALLSAMRYLSLDQRGSIILSFWLCCGRREGEKIVKDELSVKDKRSLLCGTWQNPNFATEIFYPITRRGKSIYLRVMEINFCLMAWDIFLVLILCLYLHLVNYI